MTDPSCEITFEYLLVGSQGKVQIIVRAQGLTFADKADITDAESRGKCCAQLLKRFPGVPQELIEAELDRIGSEVAATLLERRAKAEPSGNANTSDGASERDTLVRFATNGSEVTLFYINERHEAEAFATIQIGDHVETWPVRSNGFKHWLRSKYYTATQCSSPAQAFADAIDTIATIAVMTGERGEVFLRVAGHGASTYIDLGDSTWRVVQVDASAWRVIASMDCPVRFIRRKGMTALPEPTHGGSIEMLRPYVNCPTEELWTLLVGSLPSLLRPRGPYVVLVLSGEQGAAKSTTSRRIRQLVDPSVVPLRRLPRDERDLMIAANNAYFLGFDNLSHIPPAISDTLCSIATGGGFGARLLFSDDDEKLIQARRPILLNGIEDVAARPDLLDRAVLLTLPQIVEESRLEESDLDQAFDREHPLILGALLTAVSTAIRRFPEIKLSRKPRMLDFARWCTAAEAAFGWAPETFLQAYMRNRGDAVAIAIEGSAVGPAIRSLMDVHGRWEGTPGHLLNVLDHSHADELTRKRRDWPQTPKGMSDALKRIAPALRVLGINCDLGGRRAGGNRDRLIVLTRIAVPPAGMDASEPASQPRDGRDEEQANNRPGKTASTAPSEGQRDGWDAWDASCTTQYLETRCAEPPPTRSSDRDPSSNVSAAVKLGLQPSQASQPSLPPMPGPEEDDVDDAGGDEAKPDTGSSETHGPSDGPNAPEWAADQQGAQGDWEEM